MKKRYKIPLYALGGSFLLAGLAMGTLIYPGWNLSPFLGWGERMAGGALPGLELKIGRAHVQLRGGREGVFTVGGVIVAEHAGEENLRLEDATLFWPVGRLLRLRLMPERVEVAGCEVWISTDESGLPQPPRWVPTDTDAAVSADGVTGAWADLRLSSIPLIWKLEVDEEMSLVLTDYRANLRQESGNAEFALPLLEVTLRGWENGVHAHWAAGEEETDGPRWVEGRLTADVPGERIDWQNNLFLPLTPDLAEWLVTGFPFLPVPSFFETQATFVSEGETDLRAATTKARGELSLAPGAISLPGRPELRMGIPALRMAFDSHLAYGMALPVLHSDLRIRIGEGDRAAEIAVTAEVDGIADQIRMETSGALRYLEDLLTLLPDHWQPVAIQGDFSWEASMDTLYTAPAHVRVGRVSLGSGGISIVFPGDTSPSIDLASFTFAGQIEQAGQSLAVDPFHLEAGPIRLEGTGLRWDGSQPDEWGTGEVSLSPLAIAEVLALIPADLLEIPDDAATWLRETHIDRLRLAFGFLPDPTGALTGLRFRIQPEWTLRVAGMPIEGSGTVDGFPFLQTAETELTLARFNPARLRHPATQAIGQLDGEFEIALKGTFDGPERIARIVGGIEAESGVFHPGESLAPYLAGSVDLHHISLSGHLFLDTDFAAEAHLSVASALGRLAVGFHPESFPTGAPFPATLFTEANISLEPTPTAVLLDLLAHGLHEGTGLTRDELADFDLLSLKATLRGPFPTSGEIPDPSAWTGNGSLESRTGRESLGIDFALSPRTKRTVEIAWKARPWNPGRTDLVLFRRLGLPSDVVQLPLTLSGGLTLAFDPEETGDPSLVSALARVHAHGQSGSVHLPELLKDRLPLHELDLALDLNALGARIETARLRVDTPLGKLSASTEDLHLLPSPAGEGEVGLRNLDFAQAIEALNPEMLTGAGLTPESAILRGTLDELTARLEIGETPSAYPLPYLAGLAFDLRARDIHLQTSALPELHLPAILANGTLGQTSVFGSRREVFSVDLNLDGFFFPEFRLSLHSRFSESFSGDYAGCEHLRFGFRGMEGSDLQITADIPGAGREWDVRLNSRALNLAPLLLQAETWVADLFRDVPAQEGAIARQPPAPSPAQPEETSATAFPGLPDIRFSMMLDRIHIAQMRELGRMRSSVHLVDGWPHTVAFSLAQEDHLIKLDMDAREGGWETTFSLGKVHHWVASAVAPLDFYKSPLFRTDATVARLRNLPDSIDQGDFRFAGHINVRPDITASLRNISLAGLILRTEVTFLNRIAALVDRRVMLLVPFKEFRIDSLTYDAKGLITANDIFIDGPINLALNLARFDTQSFETLIEGRVFGIAFEVVGIAPDLSFYLQETRAVRAITVQDDFDW